MKNFSRTPLITLAPGLAPCLIGAAFALSGSLLARPWGKYDTPQVIPSVITKYDLLPQAGALNPSQRFGWSGHDWPAAQGGIGYRYQKQNSASPAKKWDQALGDSAGSFQAKIAGIAAKHASTPWAGICDGYSAASLIFSEPRPTEFNGVSFSSSDIKALASQFLWEANGQDGKPGEHWFIGSTCRKVIPNGAMVGEAFDPACDDPNPGSFHVALANELGVHQRGLAMDLEPGETIYNYPVIAFSAEDLGEYRYSYPRSHPATHRWKEIKTTLTYVDYQSPQHDGPLLGTRFQRQKSLVLRYVLELDADGFIVGGEWISAPHPDFLWAPKIPPFTGSWAPLESLLKQAGSL